MKEITVSMKVLVSDDKAYEELKRLEHHIEEFVDIESWPEIKEINSVKVTENDLTKDDIISMFCAYVGNDAEATELEYIQDALENAGCNRECAEKIGLGWVWPE